MKTVQEMVSYLTSNNYWIDKSLSGYYRLLRGPVNNQVDSELLIDDSACEDYYDYDSAVYSFYEYVIG